MNSIRELRSCKRTKHVSIVKLDTDQQDHSAYGLMKNMSTDGLCLESDDPIIPGTSILIVVDKLPDDSSHRAFRGIVKRCDAAGDENAMYAYEIGVKFI